MYECTERLLTGASDSFTYPLVVPGKTVITVLKAEITVEADDVPSHEIRTPSDGKFEAIFDYEKLKGNIHRSISPHRT